MRKDFGVIQGPFFENFFYKVIRFDVLRSLLPYEDIPIDP